ncbi:hypothetical protein Tdes44962_MAKER07699 [Teratosphaeria destructans]|uniref:Uncharacterized protein n=1 Tax=Teratosphaeria destructans TaxID=418781 RepID=A0A9W7SYV0_9PEZI|nr:hypothetical protein Tdes44962_MAKER07699 [Teratosphaeria destructans]
MPHQSNNIQITYSLGLTASVNSSAPCSAAASADFEKSLLSLVAYIAALPVRPNAPTTPKALMIPDMFDGKLDSCGGVRSVVICVAMQAGSRNFCCGY